MGAHVGLEPIARYMQRIRELTATSEQQEATIVELRAELEQRRQAQPVIDLIAKQVAEHDKAKPRKPTSPAAA